MTSQVLVMSAERSEMGSILSTPEKKALLASSSSDDDDDSIDDDGSKDVEVSTTTATQTRPAVASELRTLFLPLTYFLNNKFDKHVTACIVDNAVGVVFSACPQKRVVLSYYVWNTLNVYMDHIKLALNNRKKIKFTLKDITDGVNHSSICLIKPIFGRWFVQIINAGTKDEQISLSLDEWNVFLSYLPSLSRHITQLWRDETDILKQIVEGESPSLMSWWWVDQLYDEVNSSSSSVG
jgi:hypothetical protein